MFLTRSCKPALECVAIKSLRWFSDGSFHDVVPMPAQSILRVKASQSFVDVLCDSTGTEIGSVEVRMHLGIRGPCM